MNNPSDTMLFFGRFHPLFVHLPIGFLILLALLEVLVCWGRPRNSLSCVRPALVVLAPASIASALCGWLLSQGGGYDAQLLFVHQWTGIGVAVAAIALLWLHWQAHYSGYRWLLFGTVGLMSVASHFGGSLTHGSDYLIRYAPDPIRKLLGAPSQTSPSASSTTSTQSEPAFYTAHVHPLLDKYCIGCHSSDKAKGQLRLDSYEHIAKGGKAGPAIVAGQPAKSPLLQRILLPLDDDDHMPPQGKPQPTTDEVALLKWWIEAGASFDKTRTQLNPPSEIQRRLGTSFPPTPPTPTHQPSGLPALPPGEALPLAAKIADGLNIAITPIGRDEPWFQVNASVAGTNFGNAQLVQLAPLAGNLTRLDLGQTAVTDEGLATVADMTRLQRLHLHRTPVTDAGLVHLANLKELHYLNLYGTIISDAGLESLKALPKLRQLYLWGTKVTPEAAKTFRESRLDNLQLKQWEEEISKLQAKIREQAVTVDLGAELQPASKPEPTAANTLCPVSGQPVTPSKTLVHQGKLVAFCCDDCKAKFQKDPQPYLAKLKNAESAQK